MLSAKNYIVFGLPYLIGVCSLYHLTYYGLFGLNGLDFITGSDIIKSAAYPIFLTFSAAALGVFIGHRVYYSLTKQKSDSENGDESIIESVTKILFLLFFNALIVAIYYFIFGELYYPLIAFALGNVIIGLLNSNKLIHNSLNKYINREYLLTIIIYFPCFSIAVAAQDAYKIIKNKSYKYTTLITANPVSLDTIKFIGKSEQTFLFTDMENEKIYFIKSDTLILLSK